MHTHSSPHALSLFSGGLDSILAAKLLQEQNIRVTCLHFHTPFFGKPEKIPHWSKIYGLDIRPVDIAEEYTALLAARPVYGFGSVLNPCVDCKILMLRHARRLLTELEASFIISGEVLGQRPMSQRRDTLNVIQRDAGVQGLLLRPLCALHLDPTEAELSGLVDRERLLGFSGAARTKWPLPSVSPLRKYPPPQGGAFWPSRKTRAVSGLFCGLRLRLWRRISI